MAGSAGIGGLIVGTTMLVVFALVLTSLQARVDAHLEQIDAAEEPPPEFEVVNAVLETDGLVGVTVTSVGSGYSDGDTVTADGRTVGSIITDGSGGVDSVVITEPWNFSAGAPTFGSTGGAGATFTGTFGNVVFLNITNVDSTTLDLTTMYAAVDGGNHTSLSSLTRTDASGTNVYTGETGRLVWLAGTNSAWTRVAITSGDVLLGATLE